MAEDFLPLFLCCRHDFSKQKKLLDFLSVLVYDKIKRIKSQGVSYESI